MWWDKLVVNAFGSKVVLKGTGSFIIKVLEFGAESHSAEMGMTNFVCIQYGFRLAVLEGDGKDGIAVIIIKDENVVVASAGGCNKFTSLISVGLSCGFKHGCIAIMDAGTILWCKQEGIIVNVVKIIGWCWLCLVEFLFLHSWSMSLEHCNGLWWVLVQLLQG